MGHFGHGGSLRVDLLLIKGPLQVLNTTDGSPAAMALYAALVPSINATIDNPEVIDIYIHTRIYIHTHTHTHIYIVPVQQRQQQTPAADHRAMRGGGERGHVGHGGGGE